MSVVWGRGFVAFFPRFLLFFCAGGRRFFWGSLRTNRTISKMKRGINPPVIGGDLAEDTGGISKEVAEQAFNKPGGAYISWGGSLHTEVWSRTVSGEEGGQYNYVWWSKNS